MDPAQSTTPDPTKQCAVTNNSTASVVVVVPTTATDPSDDGSGTVAVYGQNLEVLPTAEGGLLIAPGKTGTVTLNQYYPDPKTGKSTYSLVYDLLVSTSNWYYPVANLGVMQGLFPPITFPAQQATPDSQQSMQQADVFYQTIAAYPTSQLAKDYQAAMSGTVDAGRTAASGQPGSSGGVANAIGNAANAFFQSTKQFKNVTLANLVAVQSYYDKFLFGWAQYKSVTYYLYGSVGSATNFVGTLTLTQPTTIDLTQPNAGYTCTFTPASKGTDTTTVDVDASQAKTLTYSNALFVDDANADVPYVALRGTYQLKRLFTQKTADTQAIVVLTGTVGGVVSIGFDSPQLSSDKSSSFWTTLFEPKGAAQIFNSIMQIGGFLMLVHFVASTAYGLYKKAFGKNAEDPKSPTSTNDFDSQRQALEKTMDEKIDAAIGKLSNGQQKPPTSPDDAMSQLAEQRDAVADNVSANNLQDGLQTQANTLEELAQYEAQMDTAQLQSLESNAQAVQESSQALTDATPSTLESVVTTQQQKLVDVQTNVGELTTDLDSALSQASKAEIDANAQTAKTVSEDVEQAKDDATGDEANPDPEVDEPTIPEAV